jgi:UDP-glucose 4-epimerase
MKCIGESIVVTGGAGFIGSCLVKTLAEQVGEYHITILDNLCNGHLEYLPDLPYISLQKADLRNKEDILKVIRDTRPDAVFHLAALHFIPYCNAHPSETLQVNVVGTQNLLEALCQYPPSKLVIASSVAVYPVNDKVNSEDDPYEPTDIYGLSKIVNEMQLKMFSSKVTTQCAAVRLSNVYGPNETNPHVIPEILSQIKQGLDTIALGNIKPKRDYIYVRDVAKALIALAQRNRHSYRVYNIGYGQEYSVSKVLAYLSNITGRQLTASVAAERVRKTDRMHLLADVQRIRTEIGWSPQVSLLQGLYELWESMKS